MTNGQLIQLEGEDIDTYASRIRSLGKRAYPNIDERHEPCLNTFLTGMRDESLYDKVITVSGAEDSFELAVQTAVKFENMRRPSRTKPEASRTTEQLDVLRNYSDNRPDRKYQDDRSDRI